MSNYDILGDDDLEGEDLALVDGDDDLDGITAGDDDLLGDDILGDDILGDDILGADDLVGAMSRKKKALLAAAGVGTAGLGYLAYKMYKRKRAKRRALAAGAIMAKRVKNSPVLAIRKPRKGREQPLPFFLAAVPVGVSTPVTTRPQTLFRGGRVVLPEMSFAAGAFVANPFAIQDIIVGRNSQFVARQQMPAAAFFQGAFGVRVQADTSQISQDVTFITLNRGAGPTDFEAVIIGESVE